MNFDPKHGTPGNGAKPQERRQSERDASCGYVSSNLRHFAAVGRRILLTEPKNRGNDRGWAKPFLEGFTERLRREELELTEAIHDNFTWNNP